MPGADSGGWSSLRADKVHEKLQVHPSQVACSSLHRTGVQFGRGCDVACPERESRGLPVSIGATSGSLGINIGGVRWFLSRRNLRVLQARSILYADRFAENSHPSGRLLILSDSLALVLALCKNRSNMFTLPPVMRRIFTSELKADFVLSSRWIPSEVNHSDTGSRFLTVKSLLHVLAQRFNTVFTVTDMQPRVPFSLTDAGCW